MKTGGIQSFMNRFSWLTQHKPTVANESENKTKDKKYPQNKDIKRLKC